MKDIMIQKFVVNFIEKGEYLHSMLCRRYTESLKGKTVEVEEPFYELCQNIQDAKLFDTFLEAKEWAKKASSIHGENVTVELVSIVRGIVTYEFQWWNSEDER